MTDDPVLDRILAIARADPRVRAVVLSGSRTDPAAPADRWRDHDLVFVVSDVAPYRANPAWVDVFGERAILQRPDLMGDAPPPPEGRGGDTWLMLFEDDTRIDVTLHTVSEMASYRHHGPARVLFDLDGVVPPPPDPAAPHFVPEPPDAAAFSDVCNEFWWVAPYIAKGLARGETTYAHHHLDLVLRDQLLRMLGWEVAAASGGRLRGCRPRGDLGRARGDGRPLPGRRARCGGALRVRVSGARRRAGVRASAAGAGGGKRCGDEDCSASCRLTRVT